MRGRLLHASLGEALETHYGSDSNDVQDRLVHHFVHSDRHDRAVLYLTRLAATAALRHAHDDTIAILSTALARADQLPPYRVQPQ